MAKIILQYSKGTDQNEAVYEFNIVGLSACWMRAKKKLLEGYEINIKIK